MANIYIPSDDTYQKIITLLQGFWLEIDEGGQPVLLIKLEASLLTSIINGVPIEVVIRNPNIAPRSCTLYIFDVQQNPFYVTWQNFSDEDDNFKGFDKVSIALAKSNKVTVVLFNELSHPIFTTELNSALNPKQFQEWLYNVYNNQEYKYLPPADEDGWYFPEDAIKGYKVQIKNIDNSQTKKLTVLAPEYIEEWRTGTVAEVESFNFEDYRGDGKHGYLQELSIANNLSKLFKPNIEFYLNPKNQDGTEFTDFIIILNEYLILLESKYVLSDKQTKKHAAVVKAVTQLNKAEALINRKEAVLENKELTEKLKNVKFISKYCILNDKTILNDENASKIAQAYSKDELPIFMSVSTFFQLIVSIKLKSDKYLLQNLMFNSLNLYSGYLNSDKAILYIREFQLSKLEVEIDEDGNIDLSKYL